MRRFKLNNENEENEENEEKEKSFWEDRNIDKSQYPLDIEYIADKNGGYLIEGGDKSNKYIPSIKAKSLIIGSLYLHIRPPITYHYTCGSFPSAIFYTSAIITDTGDTIKFFGTDRELKDIRIEIYPNPDRMQIQLLGWLVTNYEDYLNDDNKESLSISLTFPQNQFDHFFRAWEKENIDLIRLEIKKNLNGLYERDSLSPDYEYKILEDKRMVKNWEKMPEDFTDFNHCKIFNTNNDSFRITFKKTKLGKKKDDLFAKKIEFYKTEQETIFNNLIQSNQEILKFFTDKTEEIKKALWWIGFILVIAFIAKF